LTICAYIVRRIGSIILVFYILISNAFKFQRVAKK